jgi:protein PhnA
MARLKVGSPGVGADRYCGAVTLPPCPECASEYTYEMGSLLVCPECAHEWSATEEAEAAAERVIKDAFGTPLADGDDVTVIKDLKVKGASGPIKVGTKVRGIRLVDGVGDHDIDCKVPGFGPMQLKSSVVKKA